MPTSTLRPRTLLPRLAVPWLAQMICALASAATPSPQPGPAGALPVQGAVLYHNYCSVCHGDKGDGQSRAAESLSTAPRDFTSAASRRELTRERVELAITVGRPGTAMVGWSTQLSSVDIARLADYVMTRFVAQGPAGTGGQSGESTQAPISGTSAHGGREADYTARSAADMRVALPNGLKGNAMRGGAFYMANCATCHGAGGNGAGPRAYFINPRPRNFLAAESRARFNRAALFAAVADGKVGTEMPAWSKVATAQQIADVVEYVFQSYIASRPGSAAADTMPGR